MFPTDRADLERKTARVPHDREVGKTLIEIKSNAIAVGLRAVRKLFGLKLALMAGGP
jgi:hypothetical protein